jgi:S-DNA-T family DNA segregation ATPase FtsK/SpoIIIE
MRKKLSKPKVHNAGRFGEVFGIILLGVSIFIFLALISYSPKDISLTTAQPNDPPMNYIGLVGAWFSYVGLFLIGFSSFLIPAFIASLGVRYFIKGSADKFWRWLGLFILNLICLASLLELQWENSLISMSQSFGLIKLGPGGILGDWIARGFLVKLIGLEGSYIFLYSIFAATTIFLADIKVVKFGGWLIQFLKKVFVEIAGGIQSLSVRGKQAFSNMRSARSSESQDIPVIESDRPAARSKRIESALGYDEEDLGLKVKKKESAPVPVVEHKMEEYKKTDNTEKNKVKENRIQLELISPGEYQLPPISLLEDIHAGAPKLASADDLRRNGEILKNTLNEFGVEVEVVNITRGPVITRYELQPAPGVKVQRITGLSNDIALAMKAASVRIIAPIPGKAAVGIEIPNSTSTMVFLKELLLSEEFKNARKRIPLVIGKDVSGVPIVVDLTEMPHLLIAGATGSGKSVCINSIILNILYYATPDYIRFLMIDPKMVELSMYNDIPHLVIPVITDSKKAAGGLAWLVTEMERRYKILAEVGVRNLEGFNEKVSKETVTIKSSEEPLKPMPYIVVIIDELADIMIVSSYEVENSIARLAQLSRAIGIHLILATQRPSVDVITGIIKANFPARISFQVSTRVDSRTVLDAMGAEKLLGKGDLLYMPPGSSKLIRAQGPYIRESEVKKVLDFVKSQKVQANSVLNSEEILQKAQSLSNNLEQMDDETLLEEAIKVIRNTNQASVSILQRKLKIGYSRAARIMDLLEERGVVGPYKGSKARDILIDIGVEGKGA